MKLSISGAAGAAIIAVSAAAFAHASGIGTAPAVRGGTPAAAPAPLGTPAEALRTKSEVRVIVELVDPSEAPGATAAVGKRKAIAELQSAVIASAFGAAATARSGDDGLGLVRMSNIPVFAVNVDQAELESLQSDPRVRNVGLDFDLNVQLNQSVNLIQMNKAWAAPYTARGTGQAVAIMDTGVNLSHKFLKTNRIIAQSCFSGAGNASNSFCPNGKVQQIGGKSGQNCPMNYNENCSHGTHVAGIAAGFNTNKKNNEPTKGVAYTSKIIAIQVFKKSGGNINTAFSDMIKGLDWLYSNRNKFGVPVASVNMSIGGGGPFSSNCNKDNNANGPAFKSIIDKLRSAGIASVISSGNDGFLDGVSAPACVSTAVTVGASTKKASGQPEDIAYYSNMGAVVDVMAPGGDLGRPYPTGTSFTPGILSSIPGNKFSSFQGTSMAAPHVAGAFAAIRSAKGCKNKSIAAIESAMKSSGLKIEDVNFTRRRIAVKSVLDKLGCKAKSAKTAAVSTTE